MKSLLRVSQAQAAVVDEETMTPVGPIPGLDEMFAWFERNQVEDRSTIVHGDFKIDNIVTSLFFLFFLEPQGLIYILVLGLSPYRTKSNRYFRLGIVYYWTPVV